MPFLPRHLAYLVALSVACLAACEAGEVSTAPVLQIDSIDAEGRLEATLLMDEETIAVEARVDEDRGVRSATLRDEDGATLASYEVGDAGDASGTFGDHAFGVGVDGETEWGDVLDSHLGDLVLAASQAAAEVDPEEAAGAEGALALLGEVAAALRKLADGGLAYAGAPTTYRVLVLIYPKTDVTYTKFYTGYTTSHRLVASMTSGDIDRAKAAIANYQKLIFNWSAGNAAISVTYRRAPTPLRNVQRFSNDYYNPTAYALRTDLDVYAPAVEKWDNVIVIWRSDDDRGHELPYTPYATSSGPGSNSNGAGYSEVHIPLDHGKWSPDYPGEVFVHEWLHPVTSFYASKGFLMPNIDRAGDYGYSCQIQPDGGCGWKAFLSHTLQGRIATHGPDGVIKYIGIKPGIWDRGTIRTFR